MRGTCALVLCVFSLSSMAGPVAGNWSNVPIFDQAPLEVRLGTFDNGPDPDALAVVLWNDGVSNRLDAVRIPPPYDGTGVTSTGLDSGSNLFALGDICNDDAGNVVVPYIKDFNIEAARHNGGQWSTGTIPGTTTNSYTSADCGVTQNGFFVSGQDFQDVEVEIFRTTNGGGDYTFYGRYSGGLGPFSGAVRDQLATTRSGSDAMSLHQMANGQIRATHFDTSQNPPSFNHTNITMLAPPPGSFQNVRESAGGAISGFFFFSYNADGTARTVTLPIADPSMFVTEDLGAVSDTGSQFTFQGGGLVHVEGGQSSTNVLWGDYFLIDPAGGFTTDSNYPNIGVGGPVDGCLVSFGNDNLQSAYAAPRVGSDGTDLLFREEIPAAIFADGFESGDTASWSCDTPD